jgi:hypothetical protein
MMTRTWLLVGSHNGCEDYRKTVGTLPFDAPIYLREACRETVLEQAQHAVNCDGGKVEVLEVIGAWPLHYLATLHPNQNQTQQPALPAGR